MEKEMNELDSVISALFEELDEMKMKNQELEEVLKCPVCLDTCRPPLQIYQCHEGHIVCESCFSKPELVTCPQLRLTEATLTDNVAFMTLIYLQRWPTRVQTHRTLQNFLQFLVL